MAKTKPATLTTKNAKSSSQKKKNFTSAPSSVQKTGPLPPLPPYFLFRRQFVERNQGIYPNLNKAATDAWRAMSDEEKSPWVEEAAKMREEHQKMYPGYRYTWKAKPKDQKQKKKKGKKSAKSGSEKTPVLGEGEDAWTTSQGLVSSPISDTGRSLYLSTMVDLEDLAGMPLNLVQTPTPGSWSGRQAYVTQPQPIGAFPTHIVQDDFAWCYDHRPVQIRPLLNGGRAFASVAQTQPEDIASPIIHHQAESTSGLTPAASGLSGNDRQAWVGQPQPQPQPHGVGISATYRRTSTSSFPAPCAPLDDRQISIGQPQVARMDLPSPYHQALASDFIPAAPPQYQAVNSLPIASLQRVPVSQVAGMPADLLAATRNWRPSAPSVCDTQPDFDVSDPNYSTISAIPELPLVFLYRLVCFSCIRFGSCVRRKRDFPDSDFTDQRDIGDYWAVRASSF